MKKEKTIVLRLDDELYNFLVELYVKNRTNISHEVRKLIVDKYNDTNRNK
jgi:hypothetical protein